MAKHSAGILLYRIKDDQLQVLLVHPGGPFWRHKDQHAWSIPKGEVNPGEDLLHTAKREFKEETGYDVPISTLIALTPVKQKGGKIVYAWAVEGDLDSQNIKSNFFEIEWPPKSGKLQKFPEIDKGAWFDLAQAKEKIIEGQIPLLDELILKINQT
jgi:predicted NUDIX family NTP pyrophosphohydrolase